MEILKYMLFYNLEVYKISSKHFMPLKIICRAFGFWIDLLFIV